MSLPEYLILMDRLAEFERAVRRLVAEARQLFYELALLGCTCPRCGGGL